MSYDRDEAMRLQEATEAMIGMREPRGALHPDPLTADYARALPGGKLDDATYEAIESALDRASATIQDGPRWLTLAERVDALAVVQRELLAELKWCMIGAGNRTRMAAVIAKAEGRT